MAFSIKNDEADQLARQLAAVTGETLTEAVTNALRERLVRQQRATGGPKLERILRSVEAFRQLPILDDRAADDILGYDQAGLPT